MGSGSGKSGGKRAGNESAGSSGCKFHHDLLTSWSNARSLDVMKGRLLLTAVPLLFFVGLLGTRWVIRVFSARKQDSSPGAEGSGNSVKTTPVIVIGPDPVGPAAAPAAHRPHIPRPVPGSGPALFRVP